MHREVPTKTTSSFRKLAVKKAIAICHRAAYKDYVDLYFLLLEQHTSLPKIIADAQKKYREEFNDRLFLEQLVYLEDVEDVNLEFLKTPVDKKMVKEFFTREIKKQITLT